MGIEPTRPAWKAGILAIELHPHLLSKKDYSILCFNSQDFYLKNFKKYLGFIYLRLNKIESEKSSEICR